MAEVDMDLLLSVVKGLGSTVTDQTGTKVYCKDEDCLRKFWRLLQNLHT